MSDLDDIKELMEEEIDLLERLNEKVGRIETKLAKVSEDRRR